jgi:N-acetylglutamate synthase-like GNAT family acetyltransferase
MVLRAPSIQEFQQIRNFIAEFELDDRSLQPEEFTAAFRGDELVGFGRLRSHPGCTELCSLGVVTQHRRKGIGKAIVKELIRRSPGDLYLVCIIPEFFTPFGFSITGNHPSPIADKLNYCASELVVPETYVAMLLQK